MNDSEKRLTESVSALVDGEASELELHRILKQLDADRPESEIDGQGVAGKWSRYNLISQVIADAPVGSADIARSVSDAIAREKTHKAKFLQVGSHARSLGRFAIAASVAVIAIIGVQQLNYLSPLQGDSLQVASTEVGNSEQLQRPAIQFPSGFQPMVEARTVNAGGKVKTSQHPVKLIKLVSPSSDMLRNRQLGLYLNDVIDNQSLNETENGIQGMLPYARHLNLGESSEAK